MVTRTAKGKDAQERCAINWLNGEKIRKIRRWTLTIFVVNLNNARNISGDTIGSTLKVELRNN